MVTASRIGLAAGLFQAIRPGTSAQAICRHGIALLPCSENTRATAFPQYPSARPCPVGQLVNTASTSHSSSVILVNDFRPSHPIRAFDPDRSAEPPSAVIPVLSSTLLPGFSGRNFLTTTASSATSHQLRPRLSPCATASGNAGFGVRLPRLLHRLPVNDATLKHSTGLTEYRASRYFARWPTWTAEAGSLALCTVNFLWLPSDPTVGQWRPCQSDCLPLSRGDATFFQMAGFAGFAGQTKKGGP